MGMLILIRLQKKYKEKEKIYASGKAPRKKSKDAFHNFEEREYDYEALEKMLLSKGRPETALEQSAPEIFP